MSVKIFALLGSQGLKILFQGHGFFTIVWPGTDRMLILKDLVRVLQKDVNVARSSKNMLKLQDN